jgi:hypothetical protein
MRRQRFGVFARDPTLRRMGNIQFLILGVTLALRRCILMDMKS